MNRERGEQVQFILGGTPPLAALIEFVSLYVSIVDITLMQAYYAGFYAPEKTGLVFNKDVMGPATGRRVSDKIRWVRALSCKDLNALRPDYRLQRNEGGTQSSRPLRSAVPCRFDR